MALHVTMQGKPYSQENRAITSETSPDLLTARSKYTADTLGNSAHTGNLACDVVKSLPVERFLTFAHHIATNPFYSMILEHNHIRMHSELQSHLPGDQILQFLYLLKVLWVFLHVLIIEEGLEKEGEETLGKYAVLKRRCESRGRQKELSEMWRSL